MATLTNTYPYKPQVVRVALDKYYVALREKIHVRRCMLTSTGLVLAGLIIPLFMLLEVLPLSLLLGFVSFSFVATGGTLAFFYCGEI